MAETPPVDISSKFLMQEKTLAKEANNARKFYELYDDDDTYCITAFLEDGKCLTTNSLLE